VILSSLNDVFVKVQNVNVSDEEVERLIEEAATLAADEVRSHARLLRQNEVNRMAEHHRQRGFQKGEAQNARDHHAREKPMAEARQAELKAAEDRNGPKRGHTGRGW